MRSSYNPVNIISGVEEAPLLIARAFTPKTATKAVARTFRKIGVTKAALRPFGKFLGGAAIVMELAFLGIDLSEDIPRWGTQDPISRDIMLHQDIGKYAGFMIFYEQALNAVVPEGSERSTAKNYNLNSFLDTRYYIAQMLGPDYVACTPTESSPDACRYHRKEDAAALAALENERPAALKEFYEIEVVRRIPDEMNMHTEAGEKRLEIDGFVLYSVVTDAPLPDMYKHFSRLDKARLGYFKNDNQHQFFAVHKKNDDGSETLVTIGSGFNILGKDLTLLSKAVGRDPNISRFAYDKKLKNNVLYRMAVAQRIPEEMMNTEAGFKRLEIDGFVLYSSVIDEPLPAKYRQFSQLDKALLGYYHNDRQRQFFEIYEKNNDNSETLLAAGSGLSLLKQDLHLLSTVVKKTAIDTGFRMKVYIKHIIKTPEAPSVLPDNWCMFSDENYVFECLNPEPGSSGYSVSHLSPLDREADLLCGRFRENSDYYHNIRGQPYKPGQWERVKGRLRDKCSDRESKLREWQRQKQEADEHNQQYMAEFMGKTHALTAKMLEDYERLSLVWNELTEDMPEADDGSELKQQLQALADTKNFAGLRAKIAELAAKKESLLPAEDSPAGQRHKALLEAMLEYGVKDHIAIASHSSAAIKSVVESSDNGICDSRSQNKRAVDAGQAVDVAGKIAMPHQWEMIKRSVGGSNVAEAGQGSASSEAASNTQQYEAVSLGEELRAAFIHNETTPDNSLWEQRTRFCAVDKKNGRFLHIHKRRAMRVGKTLWCEESGVTAEPLGTLSEERKQAFFEAAVRADDASLSCPVLQADGDDVEFLYELRAPELIQSNGHFGEGQSDTFYYNGSEGVLKSYRSGNSVPERVRHGFKWPDTRRPKLYRVSLLSGKPYRDEIKGAVSWHLPASRRHVIAMDALFDMFRDYTQVNDATDPCNWTLRYTINDGRQVASGSFLLTEKAMRENRLKTIAFWNDIPKGVKKLQLFCNGNHVGNAVKGQHWRFARKKGVSNEVRIDAQLTPGHYQLKSRGASREFMFSTSDWANSDRSSVSLPDNPLRQLQVNKARLSPHTSGVRGAELMESFIRNTHDVFPANDAALSEFRVIEYRQSMVDSVKVFSPAAILNREQAVAKYGDRLERLMVLLAERRVSLVPEQFDYVVTHGLGLPTMEDFERFFNDYLDDFSTFNMTSVDPVVAQEEVHEGSPEYRGDWQPDDSNTARSEPPVEEIVSSLPVNANSNANSSDITPSLIREEAHKDSPEYRGDWQPDDSNTARSEPPVEEIVSSLPVNANSNANSSDITPSLIREEAHKDSPEYRGDWQPDHWQPDDSNVPQRDRRDVSAASSRKGRRLFAEDDMYRSEYRDAGNDSGSNARANTLNLLLMAGALGVVWLAVGEESITSEGLAECLDVSACISDVYEESVSGDKNQAFMGEFGKKVEHVLCEKGYPYKILTVFDVLHDLGDLDAAMFKNYLAQNEGLSVVLGSLSASQMKSSERLLKIEPFAQLARMMETSNLGCLFDDTLAQLSGDRKEHTVTVGAVLNAMSSLPNNEVLQEKMVVPDHYRQMLLLTGLSATLWVDRDEVSGRHTCTLIEPHGLEDFKLVKALQENSMLTSDIKMNFTCRSFFKNETVRLLLDTFYKDAYLDEASEGFKPDGEYGSDFAFFNYLKKLPIADKEFLMVVRTAFREGQFNNGETAEKVEIAPIPNAVLSFYARKFQFGKQGNGENAEADRQALSELINDHRMALAEAIHHLYQDNDMISEEGKQEGRSGASRIIPAHFFSGQLHEHFVQLSEGATNGNPYMSPLQYFDLNKAAPDYLQKIMNSF